MATAFDQLTVGLVLAASLVYALFALGPKALRRRSLSALAASLRCLPQGPMIRAAAHRIEAAAAKGKGGCAGCENCGAPPGEHAVQDRQPAGEVRVPVSRIRRR